MCWNIGEFARWTQSTAPTAPALPSPRPHQLQFVTEFPCPLPHPNLLRSLSVQGHFYMSH